MLYWCGYQNRKKRKCENYTEDEPNHARCTKDKNKMVSLYHVKMHTPELKTNKESNYVRWWPQMDAYRVYKDFGEVTKRQSMQNSQQAKSSLNWTA